MAEGGHYELRKSTLTSSDKSEQAEIERLRKRLQALEAKKKTEEEMALVGEQRDALRYDRLSRLQQSTPYADAGGSFITVDEEVEASHHNTADLTGETSQWLDDKLRELGIDKMPEDTDLSKTPHRTPTTTAAERMNKLMDDLEQESGLKEVDHSQIDLDDSTTTVLKSRQGAPAIQSGHNRNAAEGEEENRLGEDRESLHEEKEDPHSAYINAELEEKLKKLQSRNEEIERREKELGTKESLLDQREVEICERFRERELQMLKYEKKIDQFCFSADQILNFS